MANMSQPDAAEEQAQVKPLAPRYETPFYTIWDAAQLALADLAKRAPPRTATAPNPAPNSRGSSHAPSWFTGEVRVPLRSPTPVKNDRGGRTVKREDLDLASLRKPSDYDDDVDVSSSFTHRPNNHIAMLLHHLMTPEECSGAIVTAEAVMQTTATQYAQYDRKSDRALLHAPELAAELYARVLPLLRPEDYRDRIPLCFGHDGVWVPHSVNPVVKVVRYRKGGHFADHRDGPWIPREDQASLFTLVVYLNDDFSGGETNITGERTGGLRTRGSRGSGLHVVPTVGMGLLFNHDMQHAGMPVTEGVKYILRAEIIFERVTTGVTSMMERYAYRQNEAYIAAARLYRESTEACNAGDKAGFMAKYQLVVEEQRKAADASLLAMLGDDDDNGRPLPALVPVRSAGGERRARGLTDAEFSEVLLFLTDHEVVTLTATSRRLFVAIATSSMWRQRCVLRFGAQLPESLRAVSASAVTEHLPWASIYRQQSVFGRRFAPCVMWPTPSGTRFAFLSNAPQNTRCGSTDTRLYGAARAAPNINVETRQLAGHEWRHCSFPDVYGGLAYSYPFHMNFPMAERYTVGYAQHKRTQVEDPTPVCRDAAGGEMEWSVLVASVDKCLDAVWTPVIVIDFPTVPKSKRAAWRRSTVRDLFEIYRFPAIRCASLPEVAMVRWATERGGTVAEALPPFDLVLRIDGSVLSSQQYVVFSHSQRGADAIIAESAATAIPLYKPSATTIYIDVPPRTEFNAPFTTAPVVCDWMRDWHRQIGGSEADSSMQVRDWCWLLEGAACLGMRPEFRSESVFRHGATTS